MNHINNNNNTHNSHTNHLNVQNHDLPHSNFTTPSNSQNNFTSDLHKALENLKTEQPSNPLVSSANTNSQHNNSTTTATDVSPEIQDFVENSISLLLQLREVAEKADTLSKPDIKSIMDKALKNIYPQALDNLPVFRDIEATISSLQASLSASH
eukprot:TRINITY_DN13894_c0_g1_i1.p1 TRINITY_DN13894_c0_g1~~TRINITY_DN13894_c0_g1_i1.p1  ORF type:complete len:176 (-),score=53.46 TRINITY_DN13894_c0_g1_i1:223-684(-)